jgi:hypothetical protein
MSAFRGKADMTCARSSLITNGDEVIPVILPRLRVRLPSANLPLGSEPSIPRPQLRRRRIRSRQYNHAAVKVLNILVGQTNAAGGHEAADGRWLIGTVDPILRVAEIHRTRAERIGFAAGHEARQVRLARDHLFGREPVRPFLHAADALGARPSEALAADADAVIALPWSIVR